MEKLNRLKSHNDIHESSYEPQFKKLETAIEVIDLHKRYRNLHHTKVILNGLNLKCYAGQFYILYGTQGSGKSAIVKSILNLESFNRGAIHIFDQDVFDYHPQVGYMPQLTGLDHSLTVVETISYFAVLQDMDKHECVKNFSSLQSPMTITNRSVMVGNLNLDQKRVLSFYIAMMASPKLIVLDQPSVGVDPLYKNFFWQKLRSMVDNDDVTIFMTCSDEIDINHADVIGYLRNGQIIAEESPEALMKKFNITSFHDLILSISLSECPQIPLIESEKSDKVTDLESIKSGGFTVSHLTLDNDRNNVNQPNRLAYNNTNMKDSINAIVKPPSSLKNEFEKMWTLLEWQTLTAFRKYIRMLYYLILPVVCTLFYTYAVGSDFSDVGLGIGDYCMRPPLGNLISIFLFVRIVVVCGNNSCSVRSNKPICTMQSAISDKYLTKLNYTTYDDAEKDAAKGKIHAILLLDEKLSDHNTDDYDQKSGCRCTELKTSNAVLELRTSSKLIRSHIIDQVARSYNPNPSDDYPIISGQSMFRVGGNVDCLVDCPITPFIPILKFDKPLMETESELSVLIWGAISTFCHFSGALLGALPLCIQNRNGLMDRMTKVGVSHLNLQIVHCTTRTMFIVLQTFLILYCTVLLLKVEFLANEFFVSWLVIILQALCGFSYGILLFGILRRGVPIILYVVITELIISTICGFFYNHHCLGSFLKKLTIVIPHSSVSKFLDKVIVQNMSVFEDDIWFGFLSPIFWMISTFVIYGILFALNK